jgi:hypothetical protein
MSEVSSNGPHRVGASHNFSRKRKKTQTLNSLEYRTMNEVQKFTNPVFTWISLRLVGELFVRLIRILETDLKSLIAYSLVGHNYLTNSMELSPS